MFARSPIRRAVVASVVAVALSFRIQHGLALQAEPPERSINRLWIREEFAEEFTNLPEREGETLSDWARRTRASDQLPNKAGRYVFYRHRNPDGDHEISWWIGPFASSSRAATVALRLKRIAELLRKRDSVTYATARAVTLHAAADDSIELLYGSNPDALDLAWVLERLSQLEHIEGLKDRASRLAAEREGPIRDARARQLDLAIRELQLEEEGGGDAHLAQQLFGGRPTLSSAHADGACEALSLAVAGGAQGGGRFAKRLGEPSWSYEDLLDLRSSLGAGLKNSVPGSVDPITVSIGELAKRAKAEGGVDSSEVRLALRGLGRQLVEIANIADGVTTVPPTRALEWAALERAVREYLGEGDVSTGLLRDLAPLPIAVGDDAPPDGALMRAAGNAVWRAKSRVGPILEAEAALGLEELLAAANAMGNEVGPADLRTVASAALSVYPEAADWLDSAEPGSMDDEVGRIARLSAAMNLPIAGAMEAHASLAKAGIDVGSAMRFGVSAGAAAAFAEALEGSMRKSMIEQASRLTGRSAASLEREGLSGDEQRVLASRIEGWPSTLADDGMTATDSANQSAGRSGGEKFARALAGAARKVVSDALSGAPVASGAPGKPHGQQLARGGSGTTASSESSTGTSLTNIATAEKRSGASIAAAQVVSGLRQLEAMRRAGVGGVAAGASGPQRTGGAQSGAASAPSTSGSGSRSSGGATSAGRGGYSAGGGTASPSGAVTTAGGTSAGSGATTGSEQGRSSGSGAGRAGGSATDLGVGSSAGSGGGSGSGSGGKIEWRRK